MRSGLLNEIIKIYRPTITKNEFGEDIEVYNFLSSHRARVVHNGGSRTIATDETTFPYMKTFIVRVYVDVVEQDVIEWQSKRYRVMSIDKSRELQQITITTEIIRD